MKITKNTGRVLGVIFLLSSIAGGLGTNMRGLSGIEPNTASFLLELIKSTPQMKQAIYLDMFSSALGVIIALFLHPIINKYSNRLAVAYLGIAFVNFTLITFSNILHFEMLSVASEFSLAGGKNPENFSTLTAMLHDGYYRIHFLMLLLYGIGGIVLYYFLFKTRLVFQWLAAWGMLASLIVCIGGVAQLADVKVSFFLFLQNGIFVLGFILYLLILGFRKPALTK
jgi:hypothetical protein